MLPPVADAAIANDLHRAGHVGKPLLQQVHEVGAARGNDKEDASAGHSMAAGNLARMLKAKARSKRPVCTASLKPGTVLPLSCRYLEFPGAGPGPFLVVYKFLATPGGSP